MGRHFSCFVDFHLLQKVEIGKGNKRILSQQLFLNLIKMAVDIDFVNFYLSYDKTVKYGYTKYITIDNIGQQLVLGIRMYVSRMS